MILQGGGGAFFVCFFTYIFIHDLCSRLSRRLRCGGTRNYAVLCKLLMSCLLLRFQYVATFFIIADFENGAQLIKEFFARIFVNCFLIYNLVRAYDVLTEIIILLFHCHFAIYGGRMQNSRLITSVFELRGVHSLLRCH